MRDADPAHESLRTAEHVAQMAHENPYIVQRFLQEGTLPLGIPAAMEYKKRILQVRGQRDARDTHDAAPGAPSAPHGTAGLLSRPPRAQDEANMVSDQDGREPEPYTYSGAPYSSPDPPRTQHRAASWHADRPGARRDAAPLQQQGAAGRGDEEDMLMEDMRDEDDPYALEAAAQGPTRTWEEVRQRARDGLETGRSGWEDVRRRRQVDGAEEVFMGQRRGRQEASRDPFDFGNDERFKPPSYVAEPTDGR